jgi:hypothetical protein
MFIASMVAPSTPSPLHTVNAGTDVGAQFHHVEVSSHPRMVRHPLGAEHRLNSGDSKQM